MSEPQGIDCAQSATIARAYALADASGLEYLTALAIVDARSSLASTESAR